MGKRLGLLRAIYLVSASCMGSFAFAFDTGVISALQSLVPIREEKKEKKQTKEKNKKVQNRRAASEVTNRRRTHPGILTKGLSIYSSAENHRQLQCSVDSSGRRVFRMLLHHPGGLAARSPDGADHQLAGVHARDDPAGHQHAHAGHLLRRPRDCRGGDRGRDGADPDVRGGDVAQGGPRAAGGVFPVVLCVRRHGRVLGDVRGVQGPAVRHQAVADRAGAAAAAVDVAAGGHVHGQGERAVASGPGTDRRRVGFAAMGARRRGDGRSAAGV